MFLSSGADYEFFPANENTHGNVSLHFCIVSSNELVVLNSLENSKQYKNAGKRFCVYGGKERFLFSINFVLDFTGHTGSIFKIITSMNLRNGSFLKRYNKFTVRVLSDIKHLAIASRLYT